MPCARDRARHVAYVISLCIRVLGTMSSHIMKGSLREVMLFAQGHVVIRAGVWTEFVLSPKSMLSSTIYHTAHTSRELLYTVSEFGVSVDANELTLFTHFKLALVYSECKMSIGIFNVWNLSSVFTPISAETSPPPLRIYCGFDLCCLKPLKSFQRSRAVFFLFFLLLFFLLQYTGTRSGHSLLFSLIKALYTSVTSWSYW